MRVLIWSHLFPPSTGTFVFDQVNALKELGVKCLVVAPVPWIPRFLRRHPRYMRYGEIDREYELNGVTIIRPRILEFPKGYFFFASGLIHSWCLRRIIIDLHRKWRFDLFHAHTIMPDGFAAVQLGHSLQVPVVCTVHGSDINLYPYRSGATRMATKWALEHVDRIVAVSKALSTKVSTLAPHLHSTVVHNGADPSQFFRLDKRQARSQLGLREQDKIVVFIGNLVELKGVQDLLVAFSMCSLRNTNLYIIGDGPFRNTLLNMCVERDLTDTCHFVGAQPHSAIHLWLSAADCMVLPSYSEGMPTVLVEAMFCGVPVVATDVGGIPEILDYGRYGVLVPAANANALADAMNKVLASTESTCATVDAAEQWARDHFTWRRNAEQMWEVYKETISARL